MKILVLIGCPTKMKTYEFATISRKTTYYIKEHQIHIRTHIHAKSYKLPTFWKKEKRKLPTFQITVITF